MYAINACLSHVTLVTFTEEILNEKLHFCSVEVVSLEISVMRLHVVTLFKYLCFNTSMKKKFVIVTIFFLFVLFLFSLLLLLLFFFFFLRTLFCYNFANLTLIAV